MKYVKLNKKDLEALFLKLKSKQSWTQIAESLNISRSMLFNYKNNAYPLPYSLFKQISDRVNYHAKYNIINKDRYIFKKIRKPLLTKELAEIIGALSGDGHINKNNYEVSITCSKLDKEYIYYLKEIFERLFGLKFRIITQENIIRLKTYSKSLALFFHTIYGLPLGRKMNKLKIPAKVKDNDEVLKSYIRGLFDTDGSIYLRRQKDIVIEIISRDGRYLEEVREVLESLGFFCGISGKNLYIYQKKMISKFFRDIGSSNQKHLKKYEMYSSHMRR